MGENENAADIHGSWIHGARKQSHLSDRPLKLAIILSILFLLIFVVTFNKTDIYFIAGISLPKDILPSKKDQVYMGESISCSLTCPANPLISHKAKNSSSESCPEYFRWIQEDLKPWKNTGITQKMVQKAKSAAHIGVVIVNGKLYTKKYKKVFQTRDELTIWGILQLLRLYPGKLPDMEFMFECGDKPVIHKRGTDAMDMPPLFHYCGDDLTLDIVFPDWSFWGWPEIRIKPWEMVKREIQEGNNRIKWIDREPNAYWKGNTKLSAARDDLITCNVTGNKDWNTRIYGLNWAIERRQAGLKNTDLASKCTHRFKIYVEGIAWSVSEKYILACDSVSLLIKPHYYDFFTRSLLPTVHFWPINEDDKCRSIKFAVDWGNKHIEKAQEIGRRGSQFIQVELKMKYVYDYMFHLLHEYAKLLRYKPKIPEGAVEVCPESLICSVKGLNKKFKVHSMVDGPADTSPCTIPPPYDPSSLQSFLERKANLTKQVEVWEARENIRETTVTKYE